ncbi:hypothetical protein ACQJBY_060274 [Aegilops geniculata]
MQPLRVMRGSLDPVDAGDRSTKDKGGDPADAADSSRPFVCEKLLHGDFKGAIILQFLCTIHGGGDVHVLSATSGYRCIHSSRILAGQPSLIEKLVSLSMAQAEYSIRKCMWCAFILQLCGQETIPSQLANSGTLIFSVFLF